MGLTGDPDGMPMKVGASLADILTGMMACEGILASLFRREKTGDGERVDVSLFDSVIATLCYQAQGFLMTGENPQRLGNRHSSLAPYETFRTSDSFVIAGVGNDALWQKFVAAVGRPELDVREFAINADRVERYGELRQLLDPIFASRSTDAWVELLDSAGIPVGRVRSVSEVFDNPQIEPRRMRLSVDHPKLGELPLTGNPVKLTQSGEREHTAPPMLGEHTESVLKARLGVDDETLERLRESGVFGP